MGDASWLVDWIFATDVIVLLQTAINHFICLPLLPLDSASINKNLVLTNRAEKRLFSLIEVFFSRCKDNPATFLPMLIRVVVVVEETRCIEPFNRVVGLCFTAQPNFRAAEDIDLTAQHTATMLEPCKDEVRGVQPLIGLNVIVFNRSWSPLVSWRVMPTWCEDELVLKVGKGYPLFALTR